MTHPMPSLDSTWRPGPALPISLIEQRIIRQLQANARITNAELAERVGLSPSPCWRRVRALEGRGIIAQYCAIIDSAGLGLTVEATVSVSLEKQAALDRKSFEAQALARPEVAELQVVSDDADYLLRVFVQDTRALGRFIDTLAAIRGVRSLRSQIVLSSVRRTALGAMPLLPAELAC